MEMERIWLLRFYTCLSNKSIKKSQVGKILALRTVSETVQKTLKQRIKENVVISLQRRPNQNSLPRFPQWCELIHEVQDPWTVADLYQQKAILLVETTRDWTVNNLITTSIEALGTKVNAHARGRNCHVTIIKKLLCGWKLACTIAWETMIFINIFCPAQWVNTKCSLVPRPNCNLVCLSNLIGATTCRNACMITSQFYQWM